MKLNLRFAKLGIALAWVAGITSAQASQTYSAGTFIRDQGVNNRGFYVQEGSYYDSGSAAVQNSTIVTERRVATVASEAQANMVLSQISDRLDNHVATPTTSSVSLIPTGGNAGAGHNRSSIWARAGIDHMKEDNITRFGGWDANLWSFALGYDYKFNDKVVAGMALTYSNLNGTTRFNNGNIRDNAYGVLPYVGFKLTPCFDVDLMFGYSRVNKSRDRGTPNANNPQAADLSGARATSSPKSNRYFGAIHANLKQHVNRWNLLARLGYMYITDQQKAFTERGGFVIPTVQDRQYASLNTNISRLSLRLQAGFKASSTVEPYAFIRYARDFGASKIRGVPDAVVNAATSGVAYTSPNRRRSNDYYGGGLGLNANLQNCWSTAIEASYDHGKKFKNYGGALRISKKF
jgi:uncharacterized protein with beta-barrel porin domain